MQKLVYYPMCIFSILMLMVISGVIIWSYIVIPSHVALSAVDFYKQYWFLLTKLFVISAIFLLFAYSVEREWLATNWAQRLIAFSLIALYLKEFLDLLGIIDVVLAFANG